jgi:hypothetical protein
MSYFGNLFVSIDQLGNAIAGGNPDNTISSRIGYYNYHIDYLNNVTWYWNLFRSIVDFTFRPVDGDQHCHEAYHNDAGESFDQDTNNWGVAFLFIFIFLSCVVIAIILYFLYLLGVVSPKNINRYDNITKRLKGIKAKFKGTINEIDHHGVDSDDALRQLSKEAVHCADKLSKRLDKIAKRDSNLQ